MPAMLLADVIGQRKGGDMESMASNGGKAWDRLVDQVGRIEIVGNKTATEVKLIKLRLDLLPCNERGPRLAAVEKALDGRVSTRALVASLVTAAILGLSIGSRFL